jgi:hypothetical protein
MVAGPVGNRDNVTSNVRRSHNQDIQRLEMKKETEHRVLPLQLAFVDRVKKLMLDWTKQKEIRLHTVDCIVPFVLTDKSISVWLFYDTDKTKSDYEINGTNDIVKNQYLHLLTELNYPTDYLQEVTFFIDSDENVIKNYEGSYFYRLR